MLMKHAQTILLNIDCTPISRFRICYSSANTQTEPPPGTEGTPLTRRWIVPFIPFASPPQPESTTRYCLPSTRYVVTGASMPLLVGNSQSTLPSFASNARTLRSLVPPLITSPPAVASIPPQLGDFSKSCVQTF